MISHEILVQIENLRQQEVTFEKIGKLLDIPGPNVYAKYRLYVLSFLKAFESVVKELKLYDATKYKKECQNLLYRVHSRLKKGTKFRKVELLAPIVMFCVFKSKGVIIKLGEFCRISNISLRDFKEGLLVVNPVYLEYIKRNREEVVSQLIDRIVVQFNLDAPFRRVARKLFRKFFPLLKNTKDTIVAGLIVVLSFVALDYETQALSEILESLGTEVTRAHYHIKHKIFLPNRLGTFNGFGKSKEVLRQYLLGKIS